MKHTIPLAVVLLASTPALAHPDWAAELRDFASTCRAVAGQARSEASGCRTDPSCIGITGPNGVSYTPDQVDAIAARWETEVLTIDALAVDAEYHQDQIAVEHVAIADLGLAARSEDFEQWQLESEAQRTAAYGNVLGGIAGLVTANADDLRAWLRKASPRALKKLVKNARAWADEAGEAIVDAIGRLRGARTRKQKQKAADQVVRSLELAKELVLGDSQAMGWEAAAERLAALLELVVPAMKKAAAAEAALWIVGAKALLTDLELAAFLYWGGNAIDGLLALTDQDLRDLRGHLDRARAHVDAAVADHQQAAGLCLP